MSTSTHYGTPPLVEAEVFTAYRPGDPNRVVLHWNVAGQLAASIDGSVSDLRAMLAAADRLLSAFDGGELASGDEVTVHDPCGPQAGVVEYVAADGTVSIQGPRLAGDSRSWHWTLTAEAAGKYVAKRETDAS